MQKVYNLYAGPAILPPEALKKAQEELLNFRGTGISILEISHRSKDFDAVINGAEQKLRKILSIPENYTILFLQGGASLQFGMIPMNFLKSRTADYVHTGSWASKAIKEAKLFGTVNIAASSEDKNFSYIPTSYKFTPDAAYVHVTSNETIGGIQWQTFPDTKNVPLIADMSSDILSRNFDITKFAMVYAGAQKNIGPAGVTLVILRNDLLETGADKITTMLSYKTHAKEKSLYNTPPCFSIYIVDMVMDWILKNGGISGMQEINDAKARVLYETIDNSQIYKGAAEKKDRSKMNVTWRMKNEEQEADFIAKAKIAGFVGLKGHRSVGGCRASIYNAFSLDMVKDLVQFMKKYEKENG